MGADSGARRLDGVVRAALAKHGGLEIEKSGRFLCLFERPLEAVLFCLECHRGAAGDLPAVRAAVHLGEVELWENPPEHVERGAKPLELDGSARHVAARLLSLSSAGRTLMTRAAFEIARRAYVGEPRNDAEVLEWVVHGDYRFERPDEVVGVFEVGAPGLSSLAPPEPREEVRRAALVVDSGAAVWHPARGTELPQRRHWLLGERIAKNGDWTLWRSHHAKTRDERWVLVGTSRGSRPVLAGIVDACGLLQRELGERPGLPRLLDWRLDELPLLVELEPLAAPPLEEWATLPPGLGRLPLRDRLELAAEAAQLVAAAHAVGVAFRELTAARLRVATDAAGPPVPWLTVTTRPCRVEREDPLPAENVYALGILLFQLVSGDLAATPGPFWQRQVTDPVLRQDVAAALEPDPARRVQAAELAERLRGLEARQSTHARQQEAQQRLARRRRLGQRLATALLLLLVALASAWAVSAERTKRALERQLELGGRGGASAVTASP